MSVPPFNRDLQTAPAERVEARSRARAVVLVVGVAALVALAVLKPWPTARSGGGVANGQSPSAAAGGTEPHARIVGLDPARGVVTWSLVCTSGCGPRGSLAASPAGDEIAYAVSDGRTGWIRAVNVRTGSVRDVADCGGCVLDDVQLAWSPDRRIIAVDSGATGIWTVLAQPGTKPGSGAVHFLSLGGRDPSFSPDGSELMYVDRSGRITIVGSYSGESVQVLPFSDVRWAAWSPDRTRVAYVVDPPDPGYRGGDPFVAQLWVADLDGTHRTMLHDIPRCCIGARVEPPTWSPDGRTLAWLTPTPASAAPDRLVLVDQDGARKVDWRVASAAVAPAWLDDTPSP